MGSDLLLPSYWRSAHCSGTTEACEVYTHTCTHTHAHTHTHAEKQTHTDAQTHAQTRARIDTSTHRQTHTNTQKNTLINNNFTILPLSWVGIDHIRDTDASEMG